MCAVLVCRYDSAAQIDSDDDDASDGEQTASRKRKAPRPSQPAKKIKVCGGGWECWCAACLWG